MLFWIEVIIYDRILLSNPYRIRQNRYQQDNQEIFFEVPINLFKKNEELLITFTLV